MIKPVSMRVFHEPPTHRFYATPTLKWLVTGEEKHLVQLWKSNRASEGIAWVMVETEKVVEGKKRERREGEIFCKDCGVTFDVTIGEATANPICPRCGGKLTVNRRNL